MSAVAVVTTWGPVILRMLPQIMSVGQDLYALWCTMRGTGRQNDAVLQAMRLLNKYQDDIGRLLQDPQQKKDLLEGLAILMNKVNENDGGPGARTGRNLPLDPLKPMAASSSREYGAKSSCKGSSWKLCDVCKSDYNTADKRPTILICGHTFCRECLSIVSRRGGGGALPCPSCRTLESRPLASLPPNASLMAVLLEQLEDKGDDSWCSGGVGGDACSGLPLSYEQQVEYAILLSRQQTQEKGQDNVAANWREVDETQDKSLALALQDSEMFEASRLCALRYLAGASLNPPHKQKEAFDLSLPDGDLSLPDGDLSSPPTPAGEEEEEASLRLALQLHQEEVASMQRQGRGQGSCWSEAEDPCDWRKDYQMYFGASLCHLEQEEDTRVLQEKEKAEDKREEEGSQEEGDMCCGCSETEEGESGAEEGGKACREDECTKEEEAQCLAQTEAGKSGTEEGGKACREDECTKEEEAQCLAQTEAGKSGTEEGGKACQKDECTKEEEAQCLAQTEAGKSGTEEGGKACREDECTKEEEAQCLALRKEEELLIQEAIRLSLEE